MLEIDIAADDDTDGSSARRRDERLTVRRTHKDRTANDGITHGAAYHPVVPRTLALRAALAITLMVVYIAMAVGTVLALCWLGQFLLVHLGAGRGSIWLLALGIGSFVAAGVIVWSMFPRIDTFEPPGPEVTAAD